MSINLKHLTLEALQKGITNSDEMREWIAAQSGVAVDSRSTNAHAWALVHLQKEGLVEKIDTRTYKLVVGATPSYSVRRSIKAVQPAFSMV